MSEQAFANGLEGKPRSGPPRPPEADECVSQPFFQGVNTSDPNADSVDLFQNAKNHADAVASILAHCGQRAGFDPRCAGGTPGNYPAYFDAIATFPCFTLEFDQQSSRYQTSVNLNRMIPDITGSYQGVIEVDSGKVRTSIENMARAAHVGQHQSSYTTLFNQMAVTTAPNSDAISVSVFYTLLHMALDNSGKATYQQQEYSIRRVVFRTITSSLVVNAETLAGKIRKTSMNDWLDQNSSPVD